MSDLEKTGFAAQSEEEALREVAERIDDLIDEGAKTSARKAAREAEEFHALEDFHAH